MRKKSIKETMMLRVVAICVPIILLIGYLFLRGMHGEQVSFGIWNFFIEHRFFSCYCAAVNIITFFTYGIDKYCAIKGKRRIKIVTLIGWAFAGGSIGALLGMYTFRHKTKVNYFTVGVPLILVMQVIIIFFLMNL